MTMNYCKLIVITTLINSVVCQAANRKAQVIDITPRDNDFIRIAFGSCYGKPGRTTSIFETIGREEPDVWIWLGDATYIDMGADKSTTETVEHARARFQETLDAPGYSDLAAKS